MMLDDVRQFVMVFAHELPIEMGIAGVLWRLILKAPPAIAASILK